MAALAQAQVTLLHRRGDGGMRAALYGLSAVTAGDTLDLAADFRAVTGAYFVPLTGGAPQEVPAAGTVLTVDAGPLDAAGYLFVVGATA
jgi:hypothetical protein